MNDVQDTIPSPPPIETIPPDTIRNNTIPEMIAVAPEITEIDNAIPEQLDVQTKSSSVTITPNDVNVPLLMVLFTIGAVLFSILFYCCH